MFVVLNCQEQALIDKLGLHEKENYMTKQEFLKNFENLLEVNPGTIKEDQALGDLNEWDSLAVIGFIAMADEQFGVSLPSQEIGEAKTVLDLIALLGDRISA
jgi:acyl carrier protein